MKALAFGALMASFCWMQHALADENQYENNIRTTMQEMFNVKVKSITPAGHLGLYEVYADGHIFYTDEQAQVVIFGGELIDAKQKKNLTYERLTELSAIAFDELKLENAIKQVRGNGKRKLATFEDPNCGFCKRLAAELQKVKDTTIYVFLYPILGENSYKKSKQIWCAKDRAKAWNDWMINGIEPSGDENCNTQALDENRVFGKQHNITGTPTMFFESGKRAAGMLPLDKINENLKVAAKK